MVERNSDWILPRYRVLPFHNGPYSQMKGVDMNPAVAANGFEVTFTPEMMMWGPLILGVIQMLKDIPIVARFRDWLPFVTLLMAVGVALAFKWENPLASGLVLGLSILGGYKAANAPGNAIKKLNGKWKNGDSHVEAVAP